MLSALWRESPAAPAASGEQLATMASLLHTDAAGRPLVSALIEQSGLGAQAWLEQYLRAYLVPLLHCFYALRTGVHAARGEPHPGAEGRHRCSG